MKLKFLCLFLVLLALMLSSCSGADEPQEHPISPAVNILAEDNFMALSALKGEELRFGAEDFARALNLESIESITLTSLPSTADGSLRVGSTVLVGEQTLSSSALEFMTYSPSPSAASASFKFRVNDLPYEMTCHLYLLDSKNYAPTLKIAPKTATEVSTFEGVTYFGTLPCYDADGDETFIEIVSYPEKGVLILDDRVTGSYRYLPYDNATGKDSFVCVARDVYGNYSPALTVSLEVKRTESSARFVDLSDSPYHNAALAMNEARIMSGTQVGTSLYFYPEKTLSRAEFVVLAMNAAGISEVNKVDKTVFADDSDIPENMKSYIAAAYDLGYIRGTEVDGAICFLPHKEITRAEAAVMLANMLDLATPTFKPEFADEEAIPSWAHSSISALAASGILDNAESGVKPLEPVTRATAAQMLTNFMSVARGS